MKRFVLALFLVCIVVSAPYEGLSKDASNNWNIGIQPVFVYGIDWVSCPEPQSDPADCYGRKDPGGTMLTFEWNHRVSIFELGVLVGAGRLDSDGSSDFGLANLVPEHIMLGGQARVIIPITTLTSTTTLLGYLDAVVGGAGHLTDFRYIGVSPQVSLRYTTSRGTLFQIGLPTAIGGTF
ncbi:MAG: hypothetical protein CMH54_03290 [Myxococcales bacterium]|nr:hypothetical protein [Myxococcales bacterium]